jgi:hypothetical protein
MQRRLLLALVVYAPHLLEEHLTGMWNDPLIVRAFAPLAALPARQAAYLLFQIMLGMSLLMTYAFSCGRAGRRIVLGAIAVALLCESHHVIRAVATHSYNSGLVSAWPMPALGAWILWKLRSVPEPSMKALEC